MLTQVDLDALLQRFESSQATEADRQLLRQLLLANGRGANEQAVLQLGKYGVNVGEGKDVHIGDRIIQEASPELIRAIVQELLTCQKQLNTTAQEQTYSIASDEPVELIEIEPQIIQQINSRLASIKELQSAKHLTDSQKAELNELKTRVQSVKDVNQTLKDIASKADQLLQEAIKALAEKLKELNNSQSNSFLDINLSSCLDQQLDIVQEFRRELEAGKKVAEWLDEKRSHIAKLLGQHAMDVNPTLKNVASAKKIEGFYFTIEQFLECLSYCLLWGESSILEAPEIPKIFEDEAYIDAFNHLREIIPKRLPSSGIEQLNEYVDCLLENLPFCPNLHID